MTAEQVYFTRNYVNNDEFLAIYKDRQSLTLMSEATYWMAKTGVDDTIKKMTYDQIRNLHPIEERFSGSPLGKELDKVAVHMKRPGQSYEASYALGQAAWVVYIRENGWEKKKELDRKYNSKNVPR